MNNQPLFQGNMIQLTAVDPEKDAALISSWTTSPEFVKRYFDGIFRTYTTVEVKKLFKEKLKKADESRQDYYFAIRENEDEKMVGLLHFGWIMLSNQSAWFNMYFSSLEDFEKYSSEVLKMALRYGFMELSLHRLCLTLPSYDEDNILLYEKAGFLRETQSRQAVFHNGRFYDLLTYGILRSEWKKLQMEGQL